MYKFFNILASILVRRLLSNQWFPYIQCVLLRNLINILYIDSTIPTINEASAKGKPTNKGKNWAALMS